MDFPDWPTTDHLPPDPTIKIRFAGLMALCYNRRSKECEVGFNPGDGKHRVDIEILENGQRIFPTGSLPNIATMRFGIEGKPAGVNFFTPGSFNRQTGDPNDFQWMLDLEGDSFYPEQPDKDLDFKFSAKLFVLQGTFYTAQLTTREFDRVSVVLGAGSFDHQRVYRVPLEMDAALQLAETDVAFLEINDVVVKRLPGTAGKKYEVRFSNACTENDGRLCRFDTPTHFLESRRSDFHFHRQIFSLPIFRARFGLLLVGPPTPPPTPHNESNEEEEFKRRQGTDEAPCMAAGYGQTNGFPPET